MAIYDLNHVHQHNIPTPLCLQSYMKHINIISLGYGTVQSYDIMQEAIKATLSRFFMKIKNLQLAKY